jgi:murein peptide amidase A
MIRMNINSVSVCIIICVLLVAGCQQPQHVVKPIVLESNDDWSIDNVLPVSQYHIGGRSVQRRPIVYQTLGFGPDVVLIMATIHGSEPAGTPLVRYLARYLQDNPYLLEGRTVVVVPVANPDGLAHRSRHNARGIDLNRNFAAMNRINTAVYGASGQSEPESAFIDRLLKQYRPNRIVSIHQPLNCVDYDGPARDLAERMARKCRLPLKKLGSRPGSLGAYAGETLGIPIITFEMLAGDSSLSDVQLWNHYGEALLEAVKY